MKFKSLLLCTLFLGVSFSCSEDDPCSDTGDLPGSITFNFTLVDQDLTNLCDTTDPVYQLDSIYILSQGSTDTFHVQNSREYIYPVDGRPGFITYSIINDGRPYFTFHQYHGTLNPTQYYIHLNSTDVDTITILTDKACARAQHPRFECWSFCMKYNDRILTSCDNCSTSRSDLFRKILVYK